MLINNYYQSKTSRNHGTNLKYFHQICPRNLKNYLLLLELSTILPTNLPTATPTIPTFATIFKTLTAFICSSYSPSKISNKIPTISPPMSKTLSIISKISTIHIPPKSNNYLPTKTSRFTINIFSFLSVSH